MLQVVLLGGAILVLLTLLMLQLPQVKSWLTQRVVNYVAEKTHHRIVIEDVEVAWLDYIRLENFMLWDQQDSLMVAGETARVNFDLFGLVSNGNLQLEDISLEDCEFHLLRHEGAGSLNLKAFLEELFNKGQTISSDSSPPLALNIRMVEMARCRVTHSNLQRTKKAEFLDPNYFDFMVESGLFAELRLIADTVEMQVLEVRGVEQNGLKVDHFESDFHLDGQHLVFRNLDLRTPDSNLGDSLALRFDHFGDLAYWTDRVLMDLVLKDARLALSDLRYFTNVDLDSTLLLSGRCAGYVNDLDLMDLRLGLQTGTELIVSGHVLGLPAWRQAFADVEVSQGKIMAGDVKKVLGKYSFGDDLNFRGNFSGFPVNFVAHARFETEHGTIISDLNFEIPDRIRDAKYQGEFELVDFDVGRVLQDTLFGTTNLKASIQGSGLSRQTGDFNFKAEASNFVLREYAYDSLKLQGRFRANYYNGTVRVVDPNCKISGFARIDLSEEEEVLHTRLALDTLHLAALGWSPEMLNLRGLVSVNLQRFDIDMAVGKIDVNGFMAENPNHTMRLGKISFQASRDSVNRTYRLNSTLVSGEIQGDFLPSDVLIDLPKVAHSFEVMLTSDRDSILQEIDIFSDNPDARYEWRANFQLKDLNPLMAFFDYPVELAENSTFSADFRKSKNINFNVLATSDKVRFGNEIFIENEIDINASRSSASADVLAVVQVQSGQQQWNHLPPSENLFLESVWFNNTIDNHLEIEQRELLNRVAMNAEVKYLRDSILLKINPSDVMLIGNHWVFDRDNWVSWSHDNLHMERLLIKSDNQLISLGGDYDLEGRTSLEMQVAQFDLANLEAFIPGKELSGTVNVTSFLKRDENDLPLAALADVSVQNLGIDGFDIGTINGDAGWDTNRQLGFFTFDLGREEVSNIYAEGTFDPSKEYDQLDAKINFHQARLSMISPFVDDLVQNVAGSVSGEVIVGGPLRAPTFVGSGQVIDGQFTFGYTNATYNFNGNLAFDPYEIAFNQFQISDLSNGKGLLYGSVFHENFKDFQTNFYLDFTRMQLLNTAAVDNELFYGRAIGTGNFRASGPIDQLKLEAEITSNQGSRLFFPLGGGNNALQEDFITFSRPASDSVSVEVDRRPLAALNSGISLDLDLNVTPDAYAELIFDAQTGDIIRGRANGNLQFRMERTGDFTLLGGLEIENGAYNFTVPGINKEFQLRKGGTISWSGDPYAGAVDLQATYRQVADLKDWDSSIQNTSKIPFLVVLDLQGPMLQPEIGFSIETSDEVTILPGVDSQGLRRFLITTNDREDELNRQVFSLLMLRKLSPQNSFEIGQVGRGISGSVSEILSNQLSYWLSQSNENLEVDIDLTNLDQEAFNTFQYRLAYSFLDGRLKVSGGNSLNTAAANVTNTLSNNNNNLIGNWSVEYLLTDDGRFRVKVFSRSNQSLTVSDENNQQTGLSFQIVRSFNEFKELVTRSKPTSYPEADVPEENEKPKLQTKAN